MNHSADTAPTALQAPTFGELVEQHQRQLLDLTYSNRLLNARAGAYLLDCVDADPAAVEDALAAGKKVRLIGADAGVPARGPVLQLAVGADKADSACLKLYRRTQTRTEETGLQVLYLGIGIVEYTEPRATAPRRMPIAMLPVAMSRRSTRTGFAVESTGDTATVNTTLLEWLRRDHDIAIPGWSDNDAIENVGVECGALIAHVAETLEQHEPFAVKHDVVLGHFDYQKLAMHRDLERIKDRGVQSGAMACVSGIEGTGAIRTATTSELVRSDDLDKQFTARDLALPLPADAHQAAAVASAANGHSFVLMGPPGTGKSQTISNIIADSIAKDKSVLFCAEKAAALDAVMKRLKSIGLDRYCLDLHSRTKGESHPAADIAAELAAGKSRGDSMTTVANGQADNTALRIARTTEQLNAYAAAVQTTRQGHTFVDAVGLAQGPKLMADFRDVDDNGEQLDDLKKMLRSAMRLVKSTSDLAVRWLSIRMDAPNEAAVHELQTAANAVSYADAAVADAKAAVADIGNRPAVAGRALKAVAWYKPFARRKARQVLVAVREEVNVAVDALRTVAHQRELTVNRFCEIGWVDPTHADDVVSVVKAAAGADVLRWLRRNAELSACKAVGMDHAVMEAIRLELTPDEAAARLETGYWYAWVEMLLRDNAALRAFTRDEHEAAVESLRVMSTEWSSRYVLGHIHNQRAVWCAAAVPNMASVNRDETVKRQQVRLITKEAAKQRRHKPMRVVLKDAQDIVRAAKPCFLMSPLSVAQNLPLDYTFDLLVFDEASQIRPWDAAGVLARADQVILAGDNRQMPPTSFFDKQSIDEDDDDDLVADLESVLDQATAAGMSEQWLKMHYRSQTEGLIAFSNAHYYDHELVMVPTFDRNTPGVSLVDPNGIYETGTGRNTIEAKAIVQWAVDRILATPNESVGIVTLNSRQQELVEDLLDTARLADQRLDAAWDLVEPPIVKNLETVQGDERDHVALSVTFAPNQDGRQHNRFGPLGKQGGERRLNVAITRAKLTMTVFSSLRLNEIAVRESTGKGVRHLQAYLRYAANPFDSELLKPLCSNRSLGGYDSPFERFVAEQLRSRGWDIVTQVGSIGYRVDLGVVDQDDTLWFLAGVECDGATYHSSAYARERDAQRQQRLEERGWTILRIWSTDWWTNQEQVLNDIDAQLHALQAARRNARTGRAPDMAVTAAAAGL